MASSQWEHDHNLSKTLLVRCQERRKGTKTEAAGTQFYTFDEDEVPAAGERPVPLCEVAGPQRSDHAVRHSLGESPSLALATLGSGADPTDDTTVALLLKALLKLKMNKEEEEARR